MSNLFCVSVVLDGIFPRVPSSTSDIIRRRLFRLRLFHVQFVTFGGIGIDLNETDGFIEAELSDYHIVRFFRNGNNFVSVRQLIFECFCYLVTFRYYC